MMINKKATIKTIGEIFSNNLTIPEYQRPYKWTTKNVQQLIDDLIINFKDRKTYRIGTIVLYRNGKKNELEIVDGQQRLITLSLLIHQLKNDSDDDNKFLNQKLNHSVSYSNVINNNNFIKDNYKTLPKEDFKKYLLDTCQMVYVELEDLDEAFQFFDSQNSRGKSLESYDLLKAYHLREMKGKKDDVIHYCVERWEKSALSNDINNLDKVVNYILFRIRRWHYQQNAEIFTPDELDTFKGAPERANYPYLNPLFASKAIENLALQNPLFCNPRFLLTSFQTVQTLINGEQFFDYIQYYSDIYEKLFREKIGIVDKFKKFNENVNFDDGVMTFLNYQRYHYRVGDQYLKNLFECTVLFYFDKFGNAHLDDFIRKAFLWVYRIRLENERISFKTIENEAMDRGGLLFHIECSITPEQVLRYISKVKETKFKNVDKKMAIIFEVSDE